MTSRAERRRRERELRGLNQRVDRELNNDRRFAWRHHSLRIRSPRDERGARRRSPAIRGGP